MDMIKAGIRVFRAGLAEYILDGTPVAVTRHGQTVGVFIPTQPEHNVDLVALRRAGDAIEALLAEHNIDAEELVAEFKAAREEGRRRQRAAVAEKAQ